MHRSFLSPRISQRTVSGSIDDLSKTHVQRNDRCRRFDCIISSNYKRECAIGTLLSAISDLKKATGHSINDDALWSSSKIIEKKL
jgi:hypothetical protein